MKNTVPNSYNILSIRKNISEAFFLIRRDIILTKNIISSRFFLLLSVFGLFYMTGKLTSNFNNYLLFTLMLNLLFTSIYFTNIYLQQLKDRELVFLIVMQRKRRNILAAKMAYNALIILMMNILIHTPLIIIYPSPIVIINSYIIDSIIGMIVSFVFLSMFLFKTFEVFSNVSLFIRITIIFLFIVTIYLFKINLFDLEFYYRFNTLLFFSVSIIIVYVFYKINITRFIRTDIQ